MKKLFVFSFLIALFIGGNVTAQVTTSKIQGQIKDETGTGVYGANVLVQHMPTGTKSGTMTLDEGYYALQNLRVGGPYTVTISYVGYSTVSVTDVYLELGSGFDLDIQLVEESQQLQEVVITGGRNSTFNNNRTGSETSVGKRELTNLPTISRSASDFTRLEPSASNGSFGGRNDQYNNFTLDGSVFNNPFGLDAATPGGQTDSQPISIDAIDQISVATAPYDVTLSGFTGAAVNAVTKSGTNEFSGTAYGFFRNESMTGGKLKGEEIFVPELQQKQYGISIGGPIIENKLFFFANFEQDSREDLGQQWLPNDDNGTTTINESRVLESDLMHVQSQLASIGYDTGAYEGFMFDSESTKGIAKLDWNVNDNNRVSFVYNFLRAAKDKNAHPTALGFRGPNSQILQFENSGYTINNNIDSYLVEWNSQLSDKLSNKFQAGYTHFDDYRDAMSSPMPAFRIMDGAGTNYIVSGHEPFSVNNRLDQQVYQVTDIMTYSVKNHTLTGGFSFEKFMFDNSFNLGAYGYGDDRGYVGAFFGDFADMDAFDAAIANGLLVDAQTNAQGVYDAGNWSLAELNVGQLAFFFQDEWNASDVLKVTFGLRADMPLYFNSSDKAQEFIDNYGGAYMPDLPYVDPATGEEVLFDSTQMPSGKPLWSPRVGFNWDVHGDKTLQVRGGTGIFTGRFPFVWLNNQIANPNFFFYQTVDPEFQWPQVWRTSLGIDKKFEGGWVLTGDFSYTKDLNGAHVQNWGITTPSGTLQGPDSRPIYTSDDYANFMQNANYVFTNTDKGRIYNASVKIQKSFDNGLYLQAAYNYLNAKDVNSIEAEITGDAFAFNPVAGDANSDVLGFSKYGDRNRIIAVVSKGWNYGKDDRWGTTISAFGEYAQGGRFSYTYGGDINGDGSNLNDLLYIPTESEINEMNWAGSRQGEEFNKFIEQDSYLNENRGSYMERYGALAPWRGRWDIKWLQDFKVNDKNRVQFSMDILNFGNLLSSDWGLVQQPNVVQPVGVSVDDAGVPTYSFTGENQSTFVYDSSIASRWQMQVGLRYIFN